MFLAGQADGEWSWCNDPIKNGSSPQRAFSAKERVDTTEAVEMSTVIAGSAKRALAWRRPAGVRWMQAIERALMLLDKAATRGAEALFDGLCNASPLFHAGDKASIVRTRRMRSDGARNFLSLVQTLLASADLASGFIGRPVAGGWQRPSWGLLDTFAYGAVVPGERSFRRTQRWSRSLAAAGLVTISEIKIPRREGVRSIVAIKSLTARFYAVLGLTAAQAQARRERDRRRNEARRSQIEHAVGTMVPRKPAPSMRPTAVAVTVGAGVARGRVPPATAGPFLVSTAQTAGTAASVAIAALKAKLGLT